MGLDRGHGSKHLSPNSYSTTLPALWKGTTPLHLDIPHDPQFAYCGCMEQLHIRREHPGIYEHAYY
jgi:hypothetical protein